MEPELYYQQIEQSLTRAIQSSAVEIKIAVAWFTNHRLASLLLDKLKNGVKVQLIILNDTINFRPGGIDFETLIQKGAQLYLSMKPNRVHHKFCILDNDTVCTGSYNWTYLAENSNFENMLIASGQHKLTNQLNKAFSVAMNGSRSVSHLSRFHEMYPPENAKNEAWAYENGDLAYSFIESPDDTKIATIDRFALEPIVRVQVADEKLRRASLPLNSVIHTQKTAMKELVLLFHNWTKDELQVYRSRLNLDTLCKNQQIQWTADKLAAVALSKDQLSTICLSSRFDELPDLLSRFQDQLDWSAFSQNSQVPWTVSLLDAYREQIDWTFLNMENPAICWDSGTISRFADKLNWHRLSSSGNVAWSLELIERFADRIDFRILSANANLPWTLELFLKYEGRWDLYKLSKNESFCWSANIIASHEGQWDWKILAANKGVPWDEPLIRRYQQKFDRYTLLENPGVQWTESMLTNLSEWLDGYTINYNNGWGVISIKDGAWKTVQILQRFRNKLNLTFACQSTHIDWRAILRTELVEEMMRYSYSYNTIYTGIIGLAANPSFPWTMKLIDSKRELVGNDQYFFQLLTDNTSFIKSKVFIDLYQTTLSFLSLSNKTTVAWSNELLFQYHDRWDWSAISGNISIPWEPDLLEQLSRLNWTIIAGNSTVFKRVIEPYLETGIIDIIMAE